jgi:hypothetical protein
MGVFDEPDHVKTATLVAFRSTRWFGVSWKVTKGWLRKRKTSLGPS